MNKKYLPSPYVITGILMTGLIAFLCYIQGGTFKQFIISYVIIAVCMFALFGFAKLMAAYETFRDKL